jgi:hypothetical protein
VPSMIPLSTWAAIGSSKAIDRISFFMPPPVFARPYHNPPVMGSIGRLFQRALGARQENSLGTAKHYRG